jgi:hypothetical protein
MGFLVCAACIFTFPQPDARDVDDVRRVIERTYSAPARPWSEVGGPFAKVELRLLSPDFGIADAHLTSVGSTWTNSRDVRVLVRRVDGDWQVVALN